MRFLLVLLLAFAIGCKTDSTQVATFHKIEGKCMGTTYHITYQGTALPASAKTSVDSILNTFEDELSTYRPHSTISKFNVSESGICVSKDSYFYQSMLGASPIVESTNGAFDPTIAPLVNYYGFGYDRQQKKEALNNDTLKNILDLVGFSKLTVRNVGDSVCYEKYHPLQKLDLNASAKGHGVDIVAQWIQSQGSTNYLVEIGGEVVAKGVNEKGEKWTLGINKPSANAGLSEIILPVMLDNKAMATSGNYRNFYKNDSLVFAHIINSKTGLSQPSDVLSASVIADNCLTADGYATAFMAVGLEESKKLVEKIEGLEVCLIYHDKLPDTLAYYMSSGFSKWIKK